MKKAIAYYRIPSSPKPHGRSGLLSQESAVRQFADKNGYTLIDFYTDIAMHPDRFVFAETVRQCKSQDATLLIPHLQILGRKESMQIAKIAMILQQRIELRLADHLYQNHSLWEILATLPTIEPIPMSDRVKALLAALQFVSSKKQHD